MVKTATLFLPLIPFIIPRSGRKVNSFFVHTANCIEIARRHRLRNGKTAFIQNFAVRKGRYSFRFATWRAEYSPRVFSLKAGKAFLSFLPRFMPPLFPYKKGHPFGCPLLVVLALCAKPDATARGFYLLFFLVAKRSAAPTRSINAEPTLPAQLTLFSEASLTVICIRSSAVLPAASTAVKMMT